MKCNDKSGSVLIVVLLVLAAAAYLIMESGKFLRIDYASASYQRTIVAGGSLLRSGLLVAEELLVEDLKESRLEVDHNFDNWADFDGFLADLSASLTSGDITGSIVPEDGLIRLNHLADDNGTVSSALQSIFLRLVAGLCVAHDIEADPKDYLESIKIRIAKVDKQGDAAWYASQEPPYTMGKRQFYVPEELLLVRWKGSEPEDVRKLYYGGDGVPGLKEFVTVWSGDGKINVNTAPREIIAALVPSADFRSEFVDAAVSYRNQGENEMNSWIPTVADMVGVDKSTIPTDAVAYKSKYFRVSLTATIGAGQLNSTTILQRENDGCVVLFENIH